MSSKPMTMMVALLVVGMALGLGVGYYVAPPKVVTETQTVTVEKEPLSGKTVKIGDILAETPELEWNTPYIEKIIVPDMNKFAELLGYDVTFQILIDDAAEQGTIHLEKTQSFKAMDVNLIIGGRWSSQAAASLSYVNENNMLLWSPSSTAPTLRIADDNLYRMCPDDMVQAPAIAEMLWSWGIKAVITIQRGDAWADGIYNILVTEFPARGGVMREGDRVRYASETKEFSSYLASAEAKANELIAIYGAEHVGIELICFGADGSVLLSQVPDYPTLWGLMWFGSDGTALQNLIRDNAPSQAAHLFIPSTYAAPGESEVFFNLFNRYTAETGYTFGFYEACHYDITMTLLESVLEAQSADPKDIIPLQYPITYKKWGASGWTLLNEAGDRKATNYDIWGFIYVGTEPTYARYGLFDGTSGRVTWYKDTTTPDGRAVPGLTPPGQ